MKKSNSSFYGLVLPIRLLVSVLLGAVMFCFILIKAPFGIDLQSDVTATAALFAILYFAVLAVFSLDEKADGIFLLFTAAILAALVYLRVSMLGNPSSDYRNFLSVWIEQMQNLSIKEALTEKIGDYNMPYLYFLLFVSRSKISSLVLIKWLSCVFDFVLAYFVMKCVELKVENKLVCYLSFILTASLPTVFINSAYWAQCDSILAALCIMSVYFALKENGIGATVCFALAFSVKLQAIFILPVFVICFIVKKIKFWHAALFPATFFATLLPAMFAGRSFIDCVKIYFDQADQYPNLTLNAPSIWQIFGNFNFEYFQSVGIMLAGAAVLLLVYVCFRFKDNITSPLLLEAFYISALMIPLLLPRMHERYFYIADILSVLVFFYDRKRWYIPVVTVFASLNAYFAFLANKTTVSQPVVALALVVILVLSVKNFAERITTENESSREAVKS